MYDDWTPDPGAPGLPPHLRPSLWDLWSPGRIVALIVLLYAGNSLLQFLAFYTLDAGMFLAVLAGALGGVFLPLAALSRWANLDGRADFGLDRVDPIELLGGALLALAALSPSSLLAELSLRLHAADPLWARANAEAMAHTPSAIVLGVVGGVIAGPLAEELLFRGLLHRLLHRVWGAVAATILSPLIFALLHAEPWFLLGLVGVGVMLAIVWETTRSVAACWVAHAVYNAISLWLLYRNPDEVPAPSPISAGDWVWTAVSLLAFAGLAVYLGRRRRERVI